ncbi:hypothetical protein M9979_12980 [Sphingomonas sp. RP10(2022)]|uniref:Uncharacterized protein n=1 Tax=Sphingomonas liriopis TaxID=2949094 RepID=A0A9X2HRD6_9SPHN|nr:hypothetical protein [Sphingomonas liriopis]MCP3735788.1 hypothetical protein [Sphingomonas liriopis]
MPTDQPSNAPDAPTPREPDTAAAVLHDESFDTAPGGGGLGPRSASTGTPPHGTTPSAPIDTGLPAEDPVTEAGQRATEPR